MQSHANNRGSKRNSIKFQRYGSEMHYGENLTRGSAWLRRESDKGWREKT